LTRFTNEIHGIGSRHTANSPTFEAVWSILRPFIEDQHVVAHNAVFDVACLKHTLAFYDLAIPKFDSHCTYRIYKMGLAAACKENGIELHHHNALSDAKACAQLFLKTV
jgi:DNA polymerase-3 subunit epsilon